jgi:hypothetical protein
MYEGLKLGELPDEARLHELKVRVPDRIVIEGISDVNEGYLVYRGENWFITPDAPTIQPRKLYFLFMELCDPMKDIEVIP